MHSVLVVKLLIVLFIDILRRYDRSTVISRTAGGGGATLRNREKSRKTTNPRQSFPTLFHVKQPTGFIE